MSDNQFLQECGRRLRDLLEESPTATAVVFEFGSETTLRFDRGLGMTVESGGHTLRVPEDALDDRWVVADAV